MNKKIKPVFRGANIAGTAITVKTAPRVIADWMEAQELAGPGDIIVIDEKGSEEFNVWGGAVSWNMKRKGVEGVVIDGSTRDVEEIEAIRFSCLCKSYLPSTNHLSHRNKGPT